MISQVKALGRGRGGLADEFETSVSGEGQGGCYALRLETKHCLFSGSLLESSWLTSKCPRNSK